MSGSKMRLCVSHAPLGMGFGGNVASLELSIVMMTFWGFGYTVKIVVPCNQSST